jgi:hypothetical protein
VQLPIGGTWQLQVQIRKGDFDEWLKTVSVPIGKG